MSNSWVNAFRAREDEINRRGGGRGSHRTGGTKLLCSRTALRPPGPFPLASLLAAARDLRWVGGLAPEPVTLAFGSDLCSESQTLDPLLSGPSTVASENWNNSLCCTDSRFTPFGGTGSLCSSRLPRRDFSFVAF